MPPVLCRWRVVVRRLEVIWRSCLIETLGGSSLGFSFSEDQGARVGTVTWGASTIVRTSTTSQRKYWSCWRGLALVLSRGGLEADGLGREDSGMVGFPLALYNKIPQSQIPDHEVLAQDLQIRW